MSLNSQLQSVITQIGTEFKADRAKIGDTASLATTAKTSLVAAVNELAGNIAGAGASINDATTSTSSVWSSSKTNSSISAAVAALVDSSPGALDTLNELAAALGDDAAFATTTATALGNRLRFDAAQTLDSGQKAQGIANLGAIAAADVGDVTTNFVTVLNAALA